MSNRKVLHSQIPRAKLAPPARWSFVASPQQSQGCWDPQQCLKNSMHSLVCQDGILWHGGVKPKERNRKKWKRKKKRRAFVPNQFFLCFFLEGSSKKPRVLLNAPPWHLVLISSFSISSFISSCNSLLQPEHLPVISLVYHFRPTEAVKPCPAIPFSASFHAIIP